MTTLEEVFLKVAHIKVGGKFLQSSNIEQEKKPLAVKGDDYKDQKQTQYHEENSKLGLTNDSEKDLEEMRVKSGIFWMHFYALTKKRFIYFKKDVKSILCEIILPSIIIIAGL